MPTSLATLKTKDTEVELAEHQAREATDARRKRMHQAYIRHTSVGGIDRGRRRGRVNRVMRELGLQAMVIN